MGQITESMQFTGPVVTITNPDFPAGKLTNTMFSTTDPLVVTKQEHFQTFPAKQVGTAVTETHFLHRVKGAAGTVLYLSVTNLTACAGGSTVTVDIKKNGTTILSAVVTLDSSTGDEGFEDGILAATALVADDILTAVITAIASGTDALASGVGVELATAEDHAV